MRSTSSPTIHPRLERRQSWPISNVALKLYVENHNILLDEAYSLLYINILLVLFVNLNATHCVYIIAKHVKIVKEFSDMYNIYYHNFGMLYSSELST